MPALMFWTRRLRSPRALQLSQLPPQGFPVAGPVFPLPQYLEKMRLLRQGVYGHTVLFWVCFSGIPGCNCCFSNGNHPRKQLINKARELHRVRGPLMEPTTKL